jgi:SAM-dependent methyltransferase
MNKLHVNGKSLVHTSTYFSGFFSGKLIPVTVACFFAWMFLSPLIQAQPWDVPYVPTPYEVVDEMLDMAEVGPGDYVIDLGSGDGRIVIAATLRGAYAHGVDINPVRIREARQNAKKAGLENQLVFVEGNIFETDISKANVITMYLLNSVNLKLRPTLLKSLKPGSRVVSHDFDMNEWEPDKFVTLDGDRVYFWIIPADVKGNWSWNSGGKEFSMAADQEFQKIELQVSAGGTSLTVDKPVLKGERISFRASDPSGGSSYLFSGHVDGNTITGAVQIHNKSITSVEDWTATLD